MRGEVMYVYWVQGKLVLHSSRSSQALGPPGSGDIREAGDTKRYLRQWYLLHVIWVLVGGVACCVQVIRDGADLPLLHYDL